MKGELNANRKKADLEDQLLQRLVDGEQADKQKAQIVRTRIRPEGQTLLTTD